jgi:hypothetical protein
LESDVGEQADRVGAGSADNGRVGGRLAEDCDEVCVPGFAHGEARPFANPWFPVSEGVGDLIPRRRVSTSDAIQRGEGGVEWEEIGGVEGLDQGGDLRG